MEMLLSYQDGQRLNAVLLAGGNGTLRIALERHPDAVELRSIEGEWFDENGRAVEIDAITTDGEMSLPEIRARFVPRAYQAAG